MKPRMDVTQLLHAYTDGDREALDQLMGVVYEQLRRMAHARMREERPDHTLATTGLVHEAYLKLVDVDEMQWQSRAHFYAMASKVMRRILINYANKRKAQKRGGGAPHVELNEERLIPDAYAETLLELDEALKELQALHPRQAEVVAHRYFGGFTNDETAEVLGVSVTTVERDLRFARAWLARQWSDASRLP